MAATFTAAFIDTSLAVTGADIAVINNAAGSGVVLRIKKIFVVNTSTTSTGSVTILGVMAVYRKNSALNGSVVAPVKHDTNSANLPAGVTCRIGSSAGTPSEGNIYRRWMYYNRLAGPSQFFNNEINVIIPYTCAFDVSKDPDVEPIVVREGEAAAVQFVSGIGSATCDVFIEFTSSPT